MYTHTVPAAPAPLLRAPRMYDVGRLPAARAFQDLGSETKMAAEFARVGLALPS